MVNTAEIQVLHNILNLSSETKPPGQPNDVVFICVDCEAFEFDQNKVTELGISVLDTRDLRGTQPGESGSDWLLKMKHAHYRIQEYSKLINKRFVKGDPEGFAFGQSMWISRTIASQILAQIFHDPSDSSLSDNLRSNLSESSTRVILVAHGLRNDTMFLKKIGFNVNDVQNVVRRMDTATMAGTKKRPIALQELLRALGIVPMSSLHNAGNDAAYTLQALIAMAVREHTTPGRLAKVLAEQRAERASEKEAARAAKAVSKISIPTANNVKMNSDTNP